MHNHGRNIGNLKKRNKISVKLNICDLIPWEFSFFLILGDNTENGKGNFVLSLNFKKKKDAHSGSKIRSFEASLDFQGVDWVLGTSFNF